jgi:hypothetical protein
MIITKLFELPVPPYGCNSASFHASKSDVSLVYCYEDDDGVEFQGYIRFRTFAAFRFANESHVDRPLKEAFDCILASDDSDWLSAAKAKVPDGNKWPFKRRHFLVYLTNVGYYEVIAEDCVIEEAIQVPS